MTREELDFIGSMNMCDEISNEAYKKIVCHCEEQEPCDDVIDRAEAMTEIMMFAGNVKPDEENVYIKVSDAVQLLRDLPPVNPQKPKTGYREYNDIYDHYLCRKCKTVVMDYDNYCPNCGAKMEVSE